MQPVNCKKKCLLERENAGNKKSLFRIKQRIMHRLTHIVFLVIKNHYFYQETTILHTINLCKSVKSMFKNDRKNQPQ